MITVCARCPCLCEPTVLLLADDGGNTAGRYLIREGKKAGDFVLSVIFKTKVTHHVLEQDADSKIFTFNKKVLECATLDEVRS